MSAKSAVRKDRGEIDRSDPGLPPEAGEVGSPLKTGEFPVWSWSEDTRVPSFRSLLAQWREDRAAHRGNAFAPGFQALAVHRFGVWARSRRSPLAVRVLRRVHAMLHWVTRSFHGIELPPKARIGRRTRFAHQGGVVIHTDAAIGDDCIVRHGVTIGALRDGPGMEAPRIGDRVEIGAGAVLIGPITVGDDAVIGANVVVRKDVPPRAVVLPPEPTIVLR